MSKKKLTQEEIQELFKAAKKGEDDLYEAIDRQLSKDFVEYDFEKPDRFNIENMRSLYNISANFARDLSDFMTTALRVDIEFQANQVIEQIPYGTNYMMNLKKQTNAFCITDLGGDGLGKIIFEMDLNFLIAIHRKMMGAKDVEIPDERKPLIDIEVISTKLWIQKWLFTRLEDAFQHVCDLNLKIESIEKDIQNIRITEPTDMLAIVSLDVYLGSKKSLIRMVIPYKSIEKVIDKMTTEIIYRGEIEKNEEQMDMLREHMGRIEKEIEVKLGTSEISIRELVELTEGDVLVLDKKVKEHLVGMIAKKPKFSCVMGKKGNKVSVKITGFTEKGGLSHHE